MSFLKGQSSRVVAYILAGFCAGNWVGTYYPKQSLAFWVQPIVSLVIVVVTILATLRSNKKMEADMVVKEFSEPNRVPTEKEAAILAKAGIEIK